MSRSLLFGLLAAALLALAFRLPSLDQRPMHNDEAVNAIKFRALWTHGNYKYDPNEHHGPALEYLTEAWSKLTGAPAFAEFDEARLRIVTVLFGAGLILLLPLVADGLGRGGTICAALLTAISPGMVFYSRYYIHEMLLVFFTFLALAAGWRYSRNPKIGWALLGGLAVGMMQSTKETFVLALAAIAAGLVFNALWLRYADGTTSTTHRLPTLSPKHLVVALLAWLVVAGTLFSSFFTNGDGLPDAFRTYLPWVRRAAGASPHLHPWNFYLEHLAFFHVRNGPYWSEGFILALAVVGLVSAFTRKTPPCVNAGFIRFLGVYTLVLTALYSAIAYKTTWCLVGFLQGMILLAGVGAAALWHWASRRWAKALVAVLLLAGAGDLGWQTWQSSFNDKYIASRANPYNYSPTSPDLLKLVAELDAVANCRPEGRHLLVKVVAPEDDYWPLPWYLRNYDHVGWWSALPADPYAPVMIVSAKLDAKLDDKKTHVMAGYFELRSEVLLELYVELDLWRAYLATKPHTKE